MTTTFSSRQVPWLKVGTVIDDPDVDAREAARLGGLDFEVELRRSAFERSDGSAWRIVDSRYAVVRQDTEQFFSHVSAGYKPVQYAEAFTFMDGINPRYVSAGQFNGGRQGFMVVQLPEHMNIDPQPLGESDPHQLYVVLRTSHDLSKAIEVAVLPLRDRCMNQLPLSTFMRSTPQHWSIKHVGDVTKKLANAKLTLTRTEQYVEVFTRRVQELAQTRVTTDRLGHVLRLILPDRPGRDAQVTTIQSAFKSQPEVGFTNTAWGGVNAVSEYFEHGRESGSRTPQSRFTDGLAGNTAKYVNRVAQLLLAS
jgi:phage/plasmid-like protein (TIGR03299 family)